MCLFYAATCKCKFQWLSYHSNCLALCKTKALCEHVYLFILPVVHIVFDCVECGHDVLLVGLPLDKLTDTVKLMLHLERNTCISKACSMYALIGPCFISAFHPLRWQSRQELPPSFQPFWLTAIAD